MKQLLFCMVCFLSVWSLSAQESISRDIGDFHELHVFDGLSVTIVSSDKNQAVIEGEHIDDVVLRNKNGNLKVRMNIKKLFSGHKTFITLYTKNSIEVVDVNENALVKSEDPLSQIVMTLKAQEGGAIAFPVKVSRLTANASTGGSIQLSGTVENQSIKLNTGGSYFAKDLDAITSKVVVKAGGVADVRGTQKVEAKVRVGGTVNVYGHTALLEKQVFIGGHIYQHP